MLQALLLFATRLWKMLLISVSKMEAAGFDLVKGNTAIVPVMIYDAPLAVKFANELLKEGIYVIGFVYPVVPKGKARIRVQLSAAHTPAHIDKAVAGFIKVGKELVSLKPLNNYLQSCWLIADC